MMAAFSPVEKANAAKDKSPIYVSDYRKWSQGSSAYSEIRKYGCYIVAQNKMLREVGINTSVTSNPDKWYEWLWNNGCLAGPPNDINMKKSNAPSIYASSQGHSLKYLGYWNASDDQLWFNIKAGYHTILNVTGHFVYLDNKTSLATGQLHILDSYSSSKGSAYQTNWNDSPCKLSKYSGRIRGGHVFQPSNPVVTKPSAPGSVSLGSNDIGIGGVASVSWTASAGATGYKVTLINTADSSYNQEKTVGGTSTSFTVSQTGTYKVTVSASNTAGSSGATSSGTFTVHNDCTVTYVDWDGTKLGNAQSVRYGGNATAPVAPSREGYTFQKWSHSGEKVTSDLTIKAEYEINSYTVQFVDEEGEQIGKLQKVNYGSAATPPTDIPVKTGYVFAGWKTDAYKEVKGNLIVEAIYVWENTDLPINITITKAARNSEATGYDIDVKMVNFPNDFTTGKLVVALKTKEGKLVASGIESVSMPTSGTLEKSVTVLYSGIVTVAEVSIIGVAEDDTTGTPKSKTVTKSIDVGNEWSDWSTTVPEGEDLTVESRTEYRYKDKLVKKDVTKPATPDGYTFESSAKTGTYTAWSAWTGYVRASYTATALREVSTCTGYRYYAFRCNSCGTHDPYSGACSNCGSSVSWVEDWGTCLGTAYGAGYTKVNSQKGKIYWKNQWWYFEFSGASNGQGGTGQPTCTLSRYRTRQEYVNYTYWQTNYSDWQTTEVTESDSRQVEKRTVYRFKTNTSEVESYNYKRYKYENVVTGKTVYTYTSVYADSMEYPGEWEYYKTFTELKKYSTVDDNIILYNGIGSESWYRADVNSESTSTVYKTTSTLEDTTGTKRVLKGNIPDSAGKYATLMVYKGQNTDPIASQIEYIGQTLIDDEGNYQFDYITKEEPSAQTGDFVITLGIEGSTSYMNVGTIDAPKEIYVVEFVDDEGNTIGEQKKVVSGGSVEAPQAPEKEGYEFIGWDTGLRNIRENMIVTAKYKKKICTVIFVDWDSTSLSIKEFEYGDVLTADTVPEKEGQRFSKWLNEEGTEVTTVTENMIVQASYADTTYLITFTDWNGNVISEQEVAYGESAKLPDDLEAPSSEQKFAGWDNYEEASFVTKSMKVSPVYEYVETAEVPKFTVETGTYSEKQEVGIYSLKANQEIYYLVKPLTEEAQYQYVGYDELQLYSEPISIEESSIIFAYAKGDNVNNSEIISCMITIGEDEEPVVIPGATKTFKAVLYKGYDDVKLSWKAVPEANGYYVYYKKASSSKWSKAFSTTKTSTTKYSNLSDGVKYSFKIIPYYKDSEGEVHYSTKSAKTTTIYTLKKPVQNAVKKYNSSKVKVSWKSMEGETGYQIYKMTKKNGKYKLVKSYTTTKTSYVISASKGTTYCYKVRAYKKESSGKIYGPWSAVKSYKLKK